MCDKSPTAGFDSLMLVEPDDNVAGEVFAWSALVERRQGLIKLLEVILGCAGLQKLSGYYRY